MLHPNGFAIMEVVGEAAVADVAEAKGSKSRASAPV